MPADQMDPLLNLLDQRPREDWAWSFEPMAALDSRVNAVALCNAALLAYSPHREIERFLTNWGFEEARMFGGVTTSGFVARKESMVVISFRGTEPLNIHNWLTDVNCHQQRIPGLAGWVHTGFALALEEVWAPLLAAVDALTRQSGGRTRLYATGHSLGGALAVLAAARLQPLISGGVAGILTFGQPRVGDPEFSAAYDAALGPATFRCVNDLDVVPHLPPTRLPGRFAIQKPVGKGGVLQKARAIAGELRGALATVVQGVTYAHAGQLRLMLPDGTLTSDDLEWHKREVLYSGTLDALLKNLPTLLQAQLSQMFRSHDRILDHDPLNGYLARLERLPQ